MKKEVIIVAVLFLVGVLAFNKFFQSDDEEQIEALIQGLQNAIELNEPLKPLEIPSRVKAIEKYIMQDFRVQYVDAEVEHNFNAARDMQSKLAPASIIFAKINVIRINTMINVRGNFADVAFQVNVTGARRGNLDFNERAAITGTVQKNTDGDWVFRDMKVSRL